MKILFLDIDGVCNCEDTYMQAGDAFPIDPAMAFQVRRIVTDTGCQLVLSSAWRHSDEGMGQVTKKVHPLLGRTTRRSLGFRGSEIERWLKDNPEHLVERYAILDDDSDFFKWQPHFRTSFREGLTPGIAEKVIEHLNQEDE